MILAVVIIGVILLLLISVYTGTSTDDKALSEYDSPRSLSSSYTSSSDKYSKSHKPGHDEEWPRSNLQPVPVAPPGKGPVKFNKNLLVISSTISVP